MNSIDKGPDPLPTSSSLWRWASSLARMVLRTRTSFAAFLQTTFSLRRSPEPATAIFPIPTPAVGVFDRRPRESSSSRRARLVCQVLHIMAMALNFWWGGGRFFPKDQLERTPSSLHRSMFRRWRSLLLADGPRGVFEIASSGRRFPQLGARINELSDVLTKLGAAGGPYGHAFPGHDVPMNVASAEGLEPYRSLDVDRLKVVGEGHFDATDFLDDDLVMAYRFPDVLQYDVSDKDLSAFLLRRDPPSEVCKLAKLWDSKNLLHLHRVDFEQHVPHELTRIFNCLKDQHTDRQIGDRRGRNFTEARLQAASKTLPNGPDFLELVLSPRRQRFSICVTDRRDFYHQFWVTDDRAISNSVGPSLPFSLLADLNAAHILAAGEKLRKKRPRVCRGDDLGVSSRQAFGFLEGRTLIAFKSILQGDHLGVELATQAHANLLRTGGLLHESVRMVSDKPLPSLSDVQGLCIDDFFAVSVEDQFTPVEQSRSLGALHVAQHIYDVHKLEGSPHKDVVGADEGRVVGAYLNSSKRASQLNVCTVGSPPEKRFGLSTLSLHVAQLTHTSDSLHLCLLGGWTSVLVYRRSLMGILQESFRLVNANEINPQRPVLVPLARKVAEELTLLAVLAPLSCSELHAEYMDEVFCSDASMTHGAFCRARISSEVSQMLWRCSRTKGAYTRLQTPAECLLDRLGIREPQVLGEESSALQPQRPLALRFDFIEVFAGSGRVTSAMAELGYVCCCPIDLSRSSELNVAWVHVASWLLFMVAEKRAKSFIVEPPCTTFSIMRRPALRNQEFPFGFDVCDEQTNDGNVLAHRGFQLMWTGLEEEVTGILETPYTSKMRHLPSWKNIEKHPCSDTCRTDSCAYGSMHLKSFRFLGVHADLQPLHGRCSGDHSHVPVQGKYTLGSAVYTPMLAAALAKVLAHGVERLRRKFEKLDSLDVSGLESQYVNDVAVTSKWRVWKVWRHRKTQTI